MSAFDKIIGYEPIKKELLQIVDMIRNGDVYEALGQSSRRACCFTALPASARP